MADAEHPPARSLKQRALDELKVYWVITLYLWLFLGCFTVYRRLILAETGVAYVHYGIALVEAMVIAKVVLIGRIFGFSRRFEDRPLTELGRALGMGKLAGLFFAGPPSARAQPSLHAHRTVSPTIQERVNATHRTRRSK